MALSRPLFINLLPNLTDFVFVLNLSVCQIITHLNSYYFVKILKNTYFSLERMAYKRFMNVMPISIFLLMVGRTIENFNMCNHCLCTVQGVNYVGPMELNL